MGKLLRVITAALTLFLASAALLQGASAHVVCLGSKCYTSESVTLRLEELIIDAKLNSDESVDFSETLGLVHNSTSFDFDSLVLPDFYLPVGSEVYPEMKVTDLITGVELTRVFSFDENCTGKFIYHEDENAVQLCIRPEDQIRVRIDATILSKHDLQAHGEYAKQSDNLTNPLTLVLPPNDYEYFVSMRIEGGDGVAIHDITGFVCSDSNAEGGASDLRLIPINNGVLCQGDMGPSNGQPVTAVLAIQGVNERRVLEKQQEALNALQMESINASIRSSDATVSLSNATSITVLLTIVIALFTGTTVYTTIMTLRETRKRNKPMIKVRLDPSVEDKLALTAVNIGRSSAVDVSVECEFLPGGEKHRWHHNVIQEKESAAITLKGLKGVSLSKFLETYDAIVVRCSWEDPHGARHSDTHEIGLREYKR